MVPSSRSLDGLAVTFDDPHAVADAGLLLPATLARHLGLAELFEEHVDLGDALGHAHVGDKAMTLIHSALAGGDSIDDADALRAGSTQAVLGHAVAAPSTLGTFLRSFTWGHARQLDKVAGALLARAWAAGAGPGTGPLTLDVDSSIVETYGLKKQGGAKFTHTKVRGYHPLVAVVAGTGDVVHSRQRGGNANSGRGAGSFLAETFSRVRAAGASGAITLRADSGFYSGSVAGACRAADVRFSITVRLNPAIRKAVAQIPEEAWVAIPTSSTVPKWPRPPTDPSGRRPLSSGSSCGGSSRRRGRSSPCWSTGPTTASSPIARAARWRWRPTTAVTPRWRTPSVTSSAASGSTTSPRAASGPTRRGWRSTSWPTTWPAGPGVSDWARPSSPPTPAAALPAGAGSAHPLGPSPALASAPALAVGRTFRKLARQPAFGRPGHLIERVHNGGDPCRPVEQPPAPRHPQNALPPNAC